MSYTSFTITQPFLGAPLQFTPALGSDEFELLIDCYVNGSASKKDKLSQVTIDFYNTATVDLNTGSLVKTYNVFPAWTEQAFEQSPTQSQSSGFSPPIFTPSPGSSATYGSMMTPPSRNGTANGRVTKKAKKDTKKTAEARLPGFSIMTKDGIDVTSSAGRGTKTKEQREHAHLMRQLKACADCKRKKVRCDPSHRRSHNDMSRTSTSNASSSSSRISPAASTPSIQDAMSFSTTNAFDDLAFFSDDFTLFPDDSTLFQDDMAMWNTAAPPMNDYISQNLSHFNFDITDTQNRSPSIGAAAPTNRMSLDISHNVLFDEAISPSWDIDNYQFQDMSTDWLNSNMPGLDVPDNIQQNAPLSATLSHREQSYYIPQYSNAEPQGLADRPQLDLPQNVPLQVTNYAQTEPAGVMPTEQVHDGHTVNASLTASNPVLSSTVTVVPTDQVHNVIVANAQSRSVRLDRNVRSQSVRLDDNYIVDTDMNLHIDIDVQPTRNVPIATVEAQSQSLQMVGRNVVNVQPGNGLGQQSQLQVTVQPQLNDSQSVRSLDRQGQRLDSEQVLSASPLVSDTNANTSTVVSLSAQVQAVSSIAIAVLNTLLLSGIALVLFTGTGPLAWVRDACLQLGGNNEPWTGIVRLAVLGGLVSALFPEIFGSSWMQWSGVFGSGIGLGSVASAALGFFSGSSCASGSSGRTSISTPFLNSKTHTHPNARPSPSKADSETAGSSSSPSSFLLGLLEELTPLTVGVV